MRLEHLIANINEQVFNRIMENRTVSEEEARNTAKIVGLAALKYGDLSNQAAKDYVFDIDRFISFEGNTGPYILYTIVRIKSILNKFAENGGTAEAGKILPAASDSEKGLALIASIFMSCPMSLTVFTMTRKSFRRRIQTVRQVISA